MKVKTNVRAGKQNRNGSDNPPEAPEATETATYTYVPPVSRCVGI